MSDLIHSLADVTGTRDRDVIDVSVTFLLQDLLKPRGVKVLKLAANGGPVLEERAAMRSGEAAPTFGALALHPSPAWSEPQRTCIEGRVVVRVPANDHHTTVFPITTDRRLVGLVEVETEAALGSREEDLVAALLRIYRNHVAILDYGERDPLTGLLNRRTFEETFLRVTAGLTADAGAEHADAPFWLAVLDIDRFKSVNDRFGHLIGDEVLLLFARLVTSAMRPGDRMFRFGGEEFVVLMERTPPALAAELLERCRATVEGHAFPCVGKVTTCIGFTRIGAQDTPVSALSLIHI